MLNLENALKMTSSKMLSPLDMKAFAIVNPAAGRGRAAKLWPLVARGIEGSLGGLEAAVTSYPGQARELSYNAASAGYDLIIAAGGDGTANEVATGLFEAEQDRTRRASLLLLPLGTGCDLLRSLAPGRSLDDFCHTLLAPLERTIDAGQVRFEDSRGESQTRIFLNVASFGCGGQVARSVSLRDKRYGGRIGFQLATARALAGYKDQFVTLSFNGPPEESRPVTNFAVCNGRYFGGGMLVAPHAESDDGQFDLTQWAGYSLFDFLLQKAKLYDGRHLQDVRTDSFRSPRLAAKSEEQVLLEIDGEYVGQLPATFEVVPRAFNILLPGNADA